MRNLDVLWKTCWIPDREVGVHLHTSSKSASIFWSSFDMHIISGLIILNHAYHTLPNLRCSLDNNTVWKYVFSSPFSLIKLSRGKSDKPHETENRRIALEVMNNNSVVVIFVFPYLFWMMCNPGISPYPSPSGSLSSFDYMPTCSLRAPYTKKNRYVL